MKRLVALVDVALVMAGVALAVQCGVLPLAVLPVAAVLWCVVVLALVLWR